jgi:Actinobacteria/chloroflexi VLRF1 release factor
VTTVLVPAARVPRWFENFEASHGRVVYDVVAGVLEAEAEDGSTASAALPFDRPHEGPADPRTLAEGVGPPAAWGVLLVRKGGFAVARLVGDDIVEHKIGQRHVQGRTKAGGQSQQRFARRRDNQARAAYEAAADHAARILGDALDALVCGGDQAAVEAVLEDARLSRAAARRTSLWLPVPDPRRGVLDQAVKDAMAVRIEVTNT